MVPVSGLEDLRNESGGKYYPCELCGKKVSGMGVYITNYGSKYHTSMSCGGLKRKIYAVPISETAGERSVFEVWEIKIWNTSFLVSGGCSVYDIRIRAVPRWLLLLGSALTAAARIAGIGEGTWVYIWGAFVGIGFLIVSRCTKEALGYADSWMIFLLGMYLGIWKLVSALSFSFLAAGIWSLGKVVLKKKGRKEVIPFLPFLTAGYLGGIVW